MFYLSQFQNFVNPTAKELRKIIASGVEPLINYEITKEEILSQNFEGIDDLMNTANQVGKGLYDSIFLMCGGYDDVADELYEIPEVKAYVKMMFKKYPHILYYISRRLDGDQWLLTCLSDSIELTNRERLSAIEISEKYPNYEDAPETLVQLTLPKEELTSMLKGIIAHGRKQKDTRRAKKLAIQYATIFSNTDDTLKALKITEEELREFGFIK